MQGRVPTRMLVSIAATRLLVLPLVGLAWVLGPYMLGWYQAPDEIFILVMLLQVGPHHHAPACLPGCLRRPKPAWA